MAGVPEKEAKIIKDLFDGRRIIYLLTGLKDVQMLYHGADEIGCEKVSDLVG